MKVLILSKEGDGLGLAQRVADEGHSVRMFIQNKQYAKAGQGLISRVESWRPHIGWSDLVVADMAGFGIYEDTVKRFGKPSLGVSRVADQIELERGKGIELMTKVGIQVPETLTFDTPKAARDVLKMWEPPGWVLKPDGNISTAKTIVCRTPAVYEHALSLYSADQSLIAQRIVEGVEVSTEGWFNGRSWIEPFNHTFEEKRFMEGGLGPNTGCMGNVVLALKRRTKLVDEGLGRLEPALRKMGYRGPVDLNSIVNDEGVWGLELTPRLGYDAIEALMEGLKEPISDVLFETAVGVKREMDISLDYMIAVRASVRPWPHDDPAEEERDLPIEGINDENLRHLFLTDVYREGDDYRYAAGDGVVFKATARGRSVQEARQRVYRTVEAVEVLDKQYRRDIGTRVPTDAERLSELGYGWS